MKKECIKYQSMVETFLNGKMSGFERQNFVDHVKRCKVCHEELEIYHVIYSVMDELEEEREPDNYDYMASLEKKINYRSTKDAILTNRKVAYGLLGIGVLAVLTGVAVLLSGWVIF